MIAKKTTSETKPTYQVVEQALFAQTSLGEIKISLNAVKTKTMRKIMGIESDIAQFNELCDNVFPPEVDELPFIEGLPLMDAYFQAFAEFAEASLGESRRSSI